MPLKKRLTARLKRIGFKPRIGKVIGLRTPRGLVSYLMDFGLKEQELIGKTVLDVGAGHGEFVKEAREIGAKVTALEPRAEKTENAIKKRVQEINSSEKFDFVFANFSVSIYLNDAFNVRLSMYKMLRALKPNGRLMICPIYRRLAIKPGQKPVYHFSTTVGLGILPINSLLEKIKQSGFIVPEPVITPNNYFRMEIQRTPQSDINKLKELLSLE
ncbi:MAG: methyltransferase domain-containing protein [archaeon]|nr:methyltransferase domain-containing protein [archaeon]